MITAAIVFIATYAIIGIQRIPRIHIDRPSGALLGAVGMVAFGVLSLQEAYAAIDLDTLSFLLGMILTGRLATDLATAPTTLELITDTAHGYDDERSLLWE